MIIEIILFVLGFISFYISFLSFHKLKKAEIYKENGIRINGLSRVNYMKMIWGIFHPWAFFKPANVKNGWFLLVKILVFFILGIYLLYFSLTNLIYSYF